MTNTIKHMTTISLMTCILIVCSWVTIPAAVPFTLQTFAVFLILMMLGGRDGLISIFIYIIMGLIGIPVFSGFRGGIAHIIGPTGGYIVGFILIGLLYWIFEFVCKNSYKLSFVILFVGLFLCYIAGSIWFQISSGLNGNQYSFWKILTLCVIPYIIPDTFKLLLACYVTYQIKKRININNDMK